jgi:flagellar biosynthesis protein FlhA
MTVAGSEGGGIEPDLAETLAREVAAAVQRQEALGNPAVLLVPDRLRLPLARLVRRSVPSLRVLAHAEIPDARTIRVSATVGGKR